MANLTPKSFRLAEDTINKLKFIAGDDNIPNVVELTRLIEDRFDICLDEQLRSITSGNSKNPVEKLVYLIDNKFISQEYFQYSITLPSKLKALVLKKLKNEE